MDLNDIRLANLSTEKTLFYPILALKNHIAM